MTPRTLIIAALITACGSLLAAEPPPASLDPAAIAAEPVRCLENDRLKLGIHLEAKWHTPEHWAALVDEEGWGVGLFQPDTCSFGGGFAGGNELKGKGGPQDGQTGYLTEGAMRILDHDMKLPVRVPQGSYVITQPLVLNAQRLTGEPNASFGADVMVLPTLVVRSESGTAVRLGEGATVDGLQIHCVWPGGSPGEKAAPAIELAGPCTRIQALRIISPWVGIGWDGKSLTSRATIENAGRAS